MFYLIACLDGGGVERSKVEGGRVFFFVVENTKYFNTHTHTQGERGECFKETNNGIYPKGPRKESKLPYLDVF